MYIFENDLAGNRTPIHRKMVGPAPGGGKRAFIDFEARPFCELNGDDMIDTADLCKIFGCSSRTVYRWMSHGGLKPFAKAGRDYLFRKADVVRWYSDNPPRPGRPSMDRGR